MISSNAALIYTIEKDQIISPIYHILKQKLAEGHNVFGKSYFPLTSWFFCFLLIPWIHIHNKEVKP